SVARMTKSMVRTANREMVFFINASDNRKALQTASIFCDLGRSSVCDVRSQIEVRKRHSLPRGGRFGRAVMRCVGTKCWRRGSESNRRIKVLQTSPLPLGYRARSFTVERWSRVCPDALGDAAGS